MSTSTWTMLVGAVAGAALAVFGAGILITGRAPDATGRAFRSLHDAGLYHLLFGVGLVLVVLATAFPAGVFTLVTSGVAIGLVAVAVVRFRPRGRGRRTLSGK